ncbi:hypothetical protein [Pedobacter sp. GR22-6]|uniref:hypothetical protein n=1 Tax=Pedobacter sp. GR22-6 TaxID=3127957 RepID=UPI00307D522B
MTSANTPVNSQNWIDRINESDDYIKDMVGYFNEGWDARGEDDKQKIQDRIKANLVLTLTYVDEVLKELIKIGSTANAVFIKIDSFVSQTALLTIPIEKYLMDEFVEIYTVTDKIERDSRSENYNVRINFTFDDGSIDETILKGDGYHKSHTLKRSGE